ncbi:hypothetical protein KVT40_007891 [Elsinoe batatas]|uniref:Membrane-associated proteins in eicosanoid and glutathione metabolism n=1 Tax=Elsinoe batatas TaxID=2601811 RepID=A0A8K0PGQ8_9PEZI|nr:hypothetical protein KVT40_007891 [Elsinoe batatas]
MAPVQSLPLSLPRDYGYILLLTTLTCVNSFWHGLRVTSFRKRASLPYPTPYADSAHLSSASSPEKKQALHLFNCAQRAHGNFLENQTGVLVTMLVAGVRYPVAASVLGAVWNVGRVVYAVGYTRKDTQGGKARLQGSFFWLAQLGLMGLAGWTGAGMLGWV